MINHRILRLPRHPKLIQNGWFPDPKMVNVPKIITMNSGDGKTMSFQFPDEFVWCYRELGPLKDLTSRKLKRV